MAISVRSSSCTSDPLHPCRVQQLGTTPQAAEDRSSLQAGAGRKGASLHSLHDIELNSENKWQFPSGLAHAPRIQYTRVGYNSLAPATSSRIPVSQVPELDLTEIAICSDYSTLCHVGSAGKRTYAQRPLAIRETGLLLLVAGAKLLYPTRVDWIRGA